MRAPLRTLSAALTLSVLSLGAVACSDGSGEDTAASASSASPSPTPSATQSQPSTEPSAGSSAGSSGSPAPTKEPGTAPGAGPEVAPFLARLQEGFGTEGSVHVEMTVSGATEAAVEGDTTYGPEGSDMRLSTALGGRGQTVTMLVVDEQVYLSMPGVTRDGKYFQVPPDSEALAGFDSAALSPAESFAAFEAGLVKVVEKGWATVEGETTQRYELHLDGDRVGGAMAGGSAGSLPETLVYDVWLDSEDRMRRIVHGVSGTEITMDMTRWGEVEPVTAPDPEDVVAAPDRF